MKKSQKAFKVEVISQGKKETFLVTAKSEKRAKKKVGKMRSIPHMSTVNAARIKPEKKGVFPISIGNAIEQSL